MTSSQEFEPPGLGAGADAFAPAAIVGAIVCVPASSVGDAKCFSDSFFEHSQLVHDPTKFISFAILGDLDVGGPVADNKERVVLSHYVVLPNCKKDEGDRLISNRNLLIY